MLTFESPLLAIGEYALGVFEPYPKFELLYIMIILPFCLNAVMFWITDGYLKDNSKPPAVANATDKTPMISCTCTAEGEGTYDSLT
jgi:hypothetical protein